MQSRKQIPFLVLALAAAGSAGAWEFGYGPSPAREQGARRVQAVQHCPTGGYVAVGTQDLSGADPDVHLVRTDDSGWPGWEYSYDVSSMSLPDEGVAVAEAPGAGFVILSNVFRPPVWMPALTFVDCGGGYLYSEVYPDLAGRHSWARDLIRTANGDFAIAGVTGSGAGEDAFLMRTDKAGAPIFSWTYDALGREAFHAVTEAQPLPGQTDGDLVAVGRFTKTEDQGLVARVDGLSGMLGGATCMAAHGTADHAEVYNGVVQLRASVWAGEFAMVGSTRDSGGPFRSEIWLTRGDPCVAFTQSRIGDPFPLLHFEDGNDLVEVLVSSATAPAGSLAIAGANNSGAGTTSALLFFATPGPTQLPFAGARFDVAGYEHSLFLSLAENPPGAPSPPPGYVLAGSTSYSWAWPGDPTDLYRVYIDPNSVSPGCHSSWMPPATDLGLPFAPLAPILRPAASEIPVSTFVTLEGSPWQICP
jgi:hypothetical protein